jgi:hypothetical protein
MAILRPDEGASSSRDQRPPYDQVSRLGNRCGSASDIHCFTSQLRPNLQRHQQAIFCTMYLQFKDHARAGLARIEPPGTSSLAGHHCLFCFRRVGHHSKLDAPRQQKCTASLRFVSSLLRHRESLPERYCNTDKIAQALSLASFANDTSIRVLAMLPSDHIEQIRNELFFALQRAKRKLRNAVMKARKVLSRSEGADPGSDLASKRAISEPAEYRPNPIADGDLEGPRWLTNPRPAPFPPDTRRRYDRESVL